MSKEPLAAGLPGQALRFRFCITLLSARPGDFSFQNEMSGPTQVKTRLTIRTVRPSSRTDHWRLPSRQPILHHSQRIPRVRNSRPLDIIKGPWPLPQLTRPSISRRIYPQILLQTPSHNIPVRSRSCVFVYIRNRQITITIVRVGRPPMSPACAS